jgi:hypothetical protein
MKRKGGKILTTEETSYKANRPKRACRKDLNEKSPKEDNKQEVLKKTKPKKPIINNKQENSNDLVEKNVEIAENSIESKTGFNLVEYLKSEKWLEVLKDELEQEYFKNLNNTLKLEYSTKTIYPHRELIFNAFNLTDLDKVIQLLEQS